MQTLSDSNRIVQGLWVGPRLSTMERLSIASFLKNGHEYHLYVYNDVENVPAGTVVKDANLIVPASRIFQYKNRPSYAGFAGVFRFRLLHERGGWWADSDMVCLRQFDFQDEYVVNTELNSGRQITSCQVIKAPAFSEALAYACRVCDKTDPTTIKWGDIGPKLMAEVVEKHDLLKYQKPYYVFCSIYEWRKFLKPYVAAIHPEAYAVHMWNEEWRQANQNKDDSYHPDCLYEQLKRMYLTGIN
jgi:hypothetical protein